MDDGPLLPLFLIIFVLLVLAAFFSGSETAFFSLSRIYLKKLENSKTVSARRILKLLKKPRELLVMVLLGNTFVHMGISSLGALIALKLAEDNGVSVSLAMTLQVVISTLVIVTFCEVIPKLVALATADNFARIVSLPLQVLTYILFLPVWLIDRFSLLIARKQSSDKHLNPASPPMKSTISSNRNTPETAWMKAKRRCWWAFSVFGKPNSPRFMFPGSKWCPSKPNRLWMTCAI